MSAMLKALVLWLFILGILPESSQAQSSPETNAPDFKVIKLFSLKKHGAYVFTFCPASRELFVSFDQETSRFMYRWNVDTGRKMDTYTFPKKYRCDGAVVSPNGKVLVLVAYDMLHDALHKADKVRLMDVQKGKIIKELIYDGTPARVRFSRNGKFFVTRKYTYDAGGEHVYDINGNERKDFDLSAFGSIETNVVWEIPNSKGGPEPGLFCRDAQGKQHKLYPQGGNYWSDLGDYVVSTKGSYVAGATDTGKLMIWRTSDAKLVFDLKVGKNRFPLSYDPANQRFLFADGDTDREAWLRAVELQAKK